MIACRVLLGTALAVPLLPAQSFVDLTIGAGLGAVLPSTFPTGNGLAAGDFDGDGDLDLVVVGSPGLPIHYFRNDSGMVFTDLTAASGLGTSTALHGTATADIDNDGDLDLFVCGYRVPPMLFLNDGSGHFTEQAAQRGLVHVTSNFGASFGDYDRDGWVDLYLANHLANNTQPEANILYRNTGNGHFVDTTAVAGVGDFGATFAATFLDYDDDGWPDLVTANDKGRLRLPNNLYRNNGNGTFTSVAAQLGANIAIDGMGVDFVDAFCDGGTDVFVSDLHPNHLFMAWDATLSRYVDTTAAYGMVAQLDGWAVHFLDYDNDGWQDVHVLHQVGPDVLYRNPGQPAAALAPWPDVAPYLGLGQPWEKYSSLAADFDDDGGVDLCTRTQLGAFQAPRGLMLLRNGAATGNWLKIRTRGTVSNRDGLGARVVVQTGTHRQRQWVRSGTGFMSSNDQRLHFGLGSATVVDLVEITWPSGQVQHLTGVAANRIVTVEEPQLTLAGPAIVGATTRLDLRIDGDAGLAYAFLLALSEFPHTPLPDGSSIPLRVDALTSATFAPGNPVLPGAQGRLDAQGRASSTFTVPPVPALAGLQVCATAVTFDPTRVRLLRTAFPRALPIVLQ